MKEIIISEYGYIGCDNVATNEDKFVGNRFLTESEFKELEAYRDQNEKTEKIFTRVNAKCIKAKNYVGIIQTKSLSIEILPKIYNNSDEGKIRTLFMQMLKPLLGINEVQLDKANLSTEKNRNIHEIFIALFVEYLEKLIHRGLKSEYVSREDNQLFLKGKLKFNQHIKQNYIHKERFYVEFDEYLQDRVENRLLKSTIKLLLKKTKNFENKRRLRQQLFIFDEVGESLNHSVDISKINIHRGMEHYEIPLRFAKLFLTEHSFTSLRGKDHVFALLFPMQTVFEKYMEFVLENSKEELGIQEVVVNGGKDEYLLSSGACKMARLEPDYLLKMKNGKDIVTDAKWKQITVTKDEAKDCESAALSSGDVYQIFSYLHYYKNSYNRAYLFVPKVYATKSIVLQYAYCKKKLQIVPIDLEYLVNNNHKLMR